MIGHVGFGGGTIGEEPNASIPIDGRNGARRREIAIEREFRYHNLTYIMIISGCITRCGFMRNFSRRTILKTSLASMPALALARTAALAQTTGTGYSRQPYYGQVATGCCIPDTAIAGRASAIFRSPHFNRSGGTLSRLKIAVPNVTGMAGMTVHRRWAARIEYPLNNTIGNVILWNGAEVLDIPALPRVRQTLLRHSLFPTRSA